jgi:hypothetical protein
MSFLIMYLHIMNLIQTILLRPSVILEIYEKGKRGNQTVPSVACVPWALVPSASMFLWGPSLMESVLSTGVVAQTDR